MCKSLNQPLNLFVKLFFGNKICRFLKKGGILELLVCCLFMSESLNQSLSQLIKLFFGIKIGT